jgi:hypothetical protein
MAPTINFLNYYYRQDVNEPPTVVASGVAHKALWEAIGSGEHAGTFAPRLGNATTIFTPYNRTQTVKVKIFDTKKPDWVDVTTPGVSISSDGIGYPTTVTPGIFYGATGSENCPAAEDCFVEAEATGPQWARSIGLSATPNVYGWNDADYDYAFVLGQIGGVSIWIFGVPVVGVLPDNPSAYYREGDIIRVGVTHLGVDAGFDVCFYINGKVIYRHHGTGTSPALYPVVSFYDAPSEFSRVRFWQQDYGKDEKDMFVLGVLPVCQDKISEHEITEIAEVSEAEAQRGQDKVVRYHHRQDKWDLVFSGRRLSELQTMREFRNFHRIHIPFVMADQARGLDMFVVFETGIKDRLLQANLFDFSCTVKEF